MELTVNQTRFADHYLKSGNARESYKQAYPKVKNDQVADSNASRLLSNAKVQAYIKAKQKVIQEKTNVTLEMCINKMAMEAFGVSIDDVAEVDQDGNLKLKPEAPLSAIDGISFSMSESEMSSDKGDSHSKTKSISLKKKDQLKALDMLMKHLGIGAYGRDGSDDAGRVFQSNAGRVLDAVKNLRGKQRS